MKRTYVTSITKSKLLFCGISFCFIFVISLLFLINGKNSINSVVIINYCSIIFSLLIIGIDERIISINKIYGYFMLIFMGISPLCNYLSGYFPWDYFISDYYLILGHLMVIFWNFVYLILYIYFNRKKVVVHKIIQFNDEKLIPLFNLISTFLFIYALSSIGFNNLLTRNQNYISTGGIFDIVLDFILKFGPVITLFLVIMTKKYNIFTVLNILYLSVIVFILNYPVSSSRFNTAAVGLSILCAIIFKNYYKIHNKNSRFMDYIILFSVLIIFPMMSFFKFNTLSDLIKTGYTFDISSSFDSVDFDAFSFVARGIEYVDENGFTYGKQIINTIFFFVPKAILPIKGIPSGELIVNAQTVNGYNNVSCPFITELFLDFGFIGLIFGPIVLAWIFTKLDNFKSLLLKNNSCFNNYFLCLYSLFFSYQIYMLRGALAPTFLRFMGSVLPICIFLCLNSILARFDFRLRKVAKI